jgi:hypothetical protein
MPQYEMVFYRQPQRRTRVSIALTFPFADPTKKTERKGSRMLI